MQTNFRQLQSSPPFSVGNRIEMNQAIKLGCVVEGNPRPIVYWRMRRANGDIVDAPCPQGFEGQLQDVSNSMPQTISNNNLIVSLFRIFTNKYRHISANASYLRTSHFQLHLFRTLLVFSLLCRFHRHSRVFSSFRCSR